MKLSYHRPFFALWLALALAILPRLQTLSCAEEPEPTKESPPAVPAVAEAPSAEDKPSVAPQPAEPEASGETDKSASDKGVVDESGNDKAVTSENAGQTDPELVKPAAKKDRPLRHLGGNAHRHHSDSAKVSIMQDSTLDAGGEADSVVSIFGSSTSHGTVSDAVVSIKGSSTSSGEVGDTVVSILGDSRVTGGSVGGAVVSVFGSTYINGYVKGEVVAVLGDVELGPDAEVEGEVVCVGGELRRDPKAILHGNVQNVGLGGHHFVFDGLTAWVTKCLFYGRPLAFGAHLMWAWWIALAYLVVYVLLALAAPGIVAKGVQTLEERPGKSILAALLALLLTPLVYVLLALMVFIAIGVALIPLFTLVLFIAGLFGKAIMLSWLGRRIVKLFNAGAGLPAFVFVLIGGLVVLGLYTVPVLGFVVYKLLGVLGLGVVIYMLLLSIKSSRPVAVAPVSPPVAPVVVEDSAEVPPPLEASFVAVPPPVQTRPVISASTLPRAGFWIRVGAALLDVIMISVLFGMLHGILGWFFKVGGSFPLWFAVYNVVMWGTKGTTIGGIICGLKVVRLDDRPIEWGVAIVRGLSAFLSLVVAGLGFIWVAFDDDKQSWHDKIAGTTIVRVPKGTSLL